MTAPIGQSGNSSALTSALGAAPQKAPSADLDKDAFLKLLVAQLKYQDPMNPAQGTEFVAQTAQFTTVEKLTDLAEVQQQMLTAQLTLGAANLIGKDVTYTGPQGLPVTGKVEGATLGTSPSVTVNGVSMPMSSLTGIGKVADTSALTPTNGEPQDAFTPISQAVPGAAQPPGTAPAPGGTTPAPAAAGAPTAGATTPATGAAAPAGTTPTTTAPATTAPVTVGTGVTSTGTGVSTGSPSPAVATPTTPPGPTPATPTTTTGATTGA
ncbi:flagellar hook assembly protein FlgD [Cryptosporangium phraense]|uniref:flagellar hook assembly protein FlgD n=1 Tax=Cryptosporangium phraense TaxID=2593070 RepID=UPI00197AFBDF|nr:flagellar hook capping FlgD N-terminal domain-containing protein [Cryptosporangium phraense]